MPSHPTTGLFDRNAARQQYHEVFRAFWDAYPRKIDGTQSYNVFLDLMEEGEDPQQLIERAKAYAHNVDPGQLKYVPSPRTWLRDRRWEDNDLFQDQFVATREWLLEKYRTGDAAAVARKYGFIYTRPPQPEWVQDVETWHKDMRKEWIGRVGRHVLKGEPLEQ